MNPLTRRTERLVATLTGNTGKNACATICALTFFAVALYSQPCDNLILTSSSPAPYNAVNCIAADSGFLVNGGSVTFSAGEYIHLGNGFHSLPSFHASVLAPAPPSVVSVTPVNNTGSQQTFTFTASDPNGGADISGLQLLFANTSGADSGYGNACDFWIDRHSKGIWLRQDTGSTWNWGTPATLGVAGQALTNPQCSLNPGASSIAWSGVNLTVNLAMTFTQAYAGTHNITMEVRDSTHLPAGALPTTMGAWTVGNPPPATVTVTLASAPSALQLTVDGASCTTPCQFQWTPQSIHPVSASSQSPTLGTQYLFAYWSDGLAQSHSITTPSSAASFTANFTTQYFLTTAGSFGGTISPNSGWYPAGTPVTVTASANSGYSFTGFSGALSGTPNPQTLFMYNAASVTANFSAGLTISTPSPLTGGTTGAAYSQQFAAVGGTAPYTWSVGSGTPPGLTLANGVLGGTPTTAGTYNFTIQATDSASQNTPKAFSLTISSSSQGDFSLSMTPNTQTVAPGGSAAYTVSVTGSGGFNGAVNLGAPSGLPSGATYSFSPSSSVTASQPTTLTIIAGSANSTSTITVNGTSGALQHSASASLVVNSQPDFSLSLSPNSQTVAPGGSAAYTVSVTGSGGFNGTVTLAAPTGLPSGATYSFSPSSSITGSQPATLTIIAGSATGTSTITVNGTSGALSHTASTSLVVNSQPDFNISLSPSTAQTVAPGNSLTYTVTVTGIGGFNSAVSLSAPSLPAGVTATFTPTAISPGQTATLILSAAATGTTPGSYTLTVRGTSGTLSHDTTGTYTITTPAGAQLKEYIRLGNRVIAIENH
jgi:hypothetical protein